MENLQPKVGDRVRVRRRTWVVQDVDSYGRCRILTLESAIDGSQRRRCVIQPFDDIESASEAGGMRRVSMRSWRRACRATILGDGPAWAVRTAIPAHIDLLPYQLEPALALLRGLGSRLLIADDVGLGKTVQAMLAIAELRARGLAPRTLIVCPAGLREQWAEECAARFDLPVAIMDQQGTRAARLRSAAGLNPWQTIPMAVTSVDYLKRREVLPSVLAAHWDVVVVDEAHGVCGESDRRDALARLCHQSPFVLLLSATPHNGDEAAFATLCGLGRHGDELVVFRRTRSEVGRDSGRRAHTIRVVPTPAERRMHGALATLTRAIRRESADAMDRSVWLMLSILHKRSASSAFALAASVERRLHVLGTSEAAASQLLLPLDDESGDLDAADAAPMWSLPALKDGGLERRLLERVLDAAREAQGGEAKLRRLRRLLQSIREPVIVFTEYRDTLLHLQLQVAPGAAVVHGGLSREQRRAALDAFPTTGVLLATDAAAEGLNLQQHCRTIVHLELPWNPMRLEQRVGRVDRIGQTRRVHAFHMIAAGTGETRLLDRLVARVNRAAARVNATSPLQGRPAWSEEASARVVVLDAEETPGSDEASWVSPRVPLTRLTQSGEEESARIASLRVVGKLDDRSPIPPPCPVTTSRILIARTRRRETRRALRGRCLAVFRSVVTDAGGRTIAAHVHATLVAAGASRLTHSAIGALTTAMTSAPNTVSAGWHLESIAAHTALTTRYLRRCREVAASLARADSERQPGLFDRRAEQQEQVEREARETALAVGAERVTRAELGLSLQHSMPQPVLVCTDARVVRG